MEQYADQRWTDVIRSAFSLHSVVLHDLFAVERCKVKTVGLELLGSSFLSTSQERMQW